MSVLYSALLFHFGLFLVDLQTTQQEQTTDCPLGAPSHVKAPDERYGGDDNGKIHQQIQDISKNVDQLHVDAVPLDAFVPRKVEWRTEEQPSEENRHFAHNTKTGENVQGVSKPSFLQSEGAFVEKQNRKLSKHHSELVR